MINIDELKKIATREQTSLFPNVVREYIQHLFLSELYRLPGADKMLFKGGTALRVVYGSPRFSEDLDFSMFSNIHTGLDKSAEQLFLDTLGKLEDFGFKVELSGKSTSTSGGYFGTASVVFDGFPPVNIEINVSDRGGENPPSEADSITGDFVPTYTVFHLSQEKLVEEKIFGALASRKKPRDYYDLYFLLRKNMAILQQIHFRNPKTLFVEKMEWWFRQVN